MRGGEEEGGEREGWGGEEDGNKKKSKIELVLREK